MNLILIALVALAQDTKAIRDVKSAVEIVPGSSVFYIEIPEPKKFIATVLDHPLRAKIEALDPVKQAYAGEQFQQFQAILAHIEGQLGMKWRQALETLSEGGLALTYDARTQGLAILARSSDPAALVKMRDTFLELARSHARDNGQDDPVVEAEYKGVKAHKIGDAAFGVMGPWLVVTNKGDLGKNIFDLLTEGGKSLAAADRFKGARESLPGATAWAWLDLNSLRLFGIGDLADAGKDNPAAMMLAGGLINVLQKTPSVVGSLAVESKGVKLTLASPQEAGWSSGPREFFFGPDLKGAAPALLAVKDTVFSLSAWRDISGMWLNGADLFDEGVSDGMALAESTLTTLFSGKDFGEEILGAVGPEVQIVAARQTFAEGKPQPAVRVPSFAVIFRFKDPAKSRDEFRRTFQSFIGFLNIQGAMEGQPQLDLETERIGEHQIVSASYVVEEKDKGTKEGKINFNFSPSVAFAGNLFIISSTRDLAKELIGQVGNTTTGAGTPGGNTKMMLDAGVLRQILADNKANLVSQNMISEGHTKEEAEAATDLLLSVIGAFKGAALSLTPRPGNLALELELKLTEGK